MEVEDFSDIDNSMLTFAFVRSDRTALSVLNQHVKAAESYLHFNCLAADAVLCFYYF